MSLIVVDTDVASTLLRRRTSDTLARQLAGRTLAITFVTHGELTKWIVVCHWGPRSLDAMQTFLAALVVLPYDQRVASRWGEIQAYAQLHGRPRAANDSWIAACCLVRELPLATFNIKDYADFVEHEGLELVSEDTRRGMSRGTNHSTQEAIGDTGREQKAQVGRRTASEITTSTGLQRRERRFESCRGHQV